MGKGRTVLRKVERVINPKFEKYQWLKPEDLLEIQKRHLCSMIRAAYRHVPYWHREMKRRGIGPDDVKCAADLRKLPITSKVGMRGKEEFIADNIKWLGPELWHTGGSTGQMLSYYTTDLSRHAIDSCRIRGWKWAGCQPRDKIATFTGGGLSSKNLRLDCVGMDEKVMDKHIEMINKSRVDAYRGIPSALMTFARHVERRGLDMKKKCVLTTSENLLPVHRKFIGDVLGEVYDGYGANDGGSSAFECEEHKGWHISADKSIFEVLDRNGNPVAPGEEGILTVTCLFNYGMPWIRYMSNDLAVLSDEKCSCGRGLPLMSKLLGRTTDLIRTRNTVINGTELANNVIGHNLPIRAFQFIQTSAQRLEVRIARESDWSEEHRVVILNILQTYDPQIEVTFTFPEDIPKTPAGKSQYVISQLK
ncbi:MAG: hypothetical protein PHU53_01180 [Thermoplasmata archaeon]|nr:hypothetical protein [Thermoplasmata archaeon]